MLAQFPLRVIPAHIFFVVESLATNGIKGMGAVVSCKREGFITFREKEREREKKNFRCRRLFRISGVGEKKRKRNVERLKKGGKEEEEERAR